MLTNPGDSSPVSKPTLSGINDLDLHSAWYRVTMWGVKFQKSEMGARLPAPHAQHVMQVPQKEHDRRPVVSSAQIRHNDNPLLTAHPSLPADVC